MEGFLAGLHDSRLHGYSAEFAEYRPYIPGDDVRYIDWRLYARTDRYYVRRFVEDTNLTCYILVDTSGSMAYKPGPLSKFDYARFLAASLAYLAISQRDRVALLSFSKAIKSVLPPGGGERHFTAFLHNIELLAAQGQSYFGQAPGGIAEKVGHKGLVVIISDLYLDPPQAAREFIRLRRAGHEVIVFHLLDQSERALEFEGAVEFEDLETGERVAIDPARVRREYARRLDEMVDFYRKRLIREGIDFVSIDTSLPLDSALVSYLRRRDRRRP